MLKQRVITAIVLLLLLMPTFFIEDPRPFCALALVFISAGTWEWAKLNGYSQRVSLGVAGALLMACSLLWILGALNQQLPALWILAGSSWVLFGALLLRGAVHAWGHYSKAIRLTGGALALCVAWLAVAQARVIGVNFLLSILVLVWVADIFAYFTGKAIGGRFFKQKLAPGISPGKSWEGALGGMVGVVVLAFGWRWADAHWSNFVPSLYSQLGNKSGWLLLIAAVFLATMSVAGDLLESLVKRSAGVKDSSGLLPGHGGVLDRVDALLPTLPLAMMLYSLQRFG
jgi:phosphatidate cytidylyltransferase